MYNKNTREKQYDKSEASDSQTLVSGSQFMPNKNDQ